jgi:glycosyltransferase involved in cell wall biosynthesis
METLRIVQVTHSFPPYFGGLSYVTDMISRYLVKEGHEVEVVTLDVDGNLPSHEVVDGICVNRFPGYAPSNAYFMPSRSAFRYLQSLKGDVIHAHNIGALFAPACWIAIRDRLGAAAFVLTPHHHTAGSQWHTRLLWRPYWPVARLVVRAADTVHCVSHFESKVVSHDFSVDSVVIPNGVSDDVLSHRWSPPRDLILTYAGRLERYKRVDRLIQAARLMSSRGNRVSVRVIGDGPDLRRLVSLAHSMDVTLERHPFLEREEYLEMLATSSCFVNLSKYEAFSIVVAEALAIGVPVVAALPWGETFRGFGGVRLVDADSTLDVANAAQALASGGHEIGERIPSWQEVVRRLISEAYRPALEKKAA